MSDSGVTFTTNPNHRAPFMEVSPAASRLYNLLTLLQACDLPAPSAGEISLILKTPEVDIAQALRTLIDERFVCQVQP